MNNPPFISQLWREYPHKILQATTSSRKNKIVGDSRLGHSLIAAGREVLQDLELINKAIEDKSFFKNQELISAFDFAKNHHSNVHFLGMVSKGGIHSHLTHLEAFLETAF